MPYVFISRREKRKLTQPEDNLRINFIYDVQIKERDVRSPEILYNPNSGKRICKLRRENKENL
jgi:hypothetical protein